MEKIKTRMKQRKNLRAKDIADELSIGLSTVWLYAKQRKITPIKLGERITVFSIDEINKVFGVDISKLVEVEIKQRKQKSKKRQIKTDKEMQEEWIKKNSA